MIEPIRAGRAAVTTFLVLVSTLLASAGFAMRAGDDETGPATAPSARPTVARFGGADLEITLPEGWREYADRSGHQWSQLTLSRTDGSRAHAYFNAEAKVDLVGNIDAVTHLQNQKEVITHFLENRSIEEIETFEHDGRPAARLSFVGESAGRRWAYIVTVIETEHYLVMTMAGTPPSKLEAERGALEHLGTLARETK